MANATKINPPEISRYFEGKCFKKFPSQNPSNDIKKEKTPILNAGKSNLLPENTKVLPATRASILVATPNPSKQLNPIQQSFSFSSFEKASKTNFIPSIKKTENTINLLNGAKISRTEFAPTYPKQGINPWNNPIVSANTMEFFNL